MSQPRTPREQLERAMHVSFKLPEQVREMLDAYRDQVLAEAADIASDERSRLDEMGEHLVARGASCAAARIRRAARTGQEAPAPGASAPACACRAQGQDGDGRVRYQGRDGEFVNLPCRDHEQQADAQCPRNPGGGHMFKPAALKPGRFCAYCGTPEAAAR